MNSIKITFYLLSLFFFIACNPVSSQSKTEKLTTESDSLINDDYSIPEFAIKKVLYKDQDSLSELDSLRKTNIVSKLTELEGNFMGDTDDNDLYGHPVASQEGFSIWTSSKSTRKEIFFRASTINKEYVFYEEDNNLLLVLEEVFDEEAKFTGDSIFFDKGKIFFWKSTRNLYVTNKEMLLGKQDFFLNLFEELSSLEDIVFQEYKNKEGNSMTRFVQSNVK